ncbi:hypothetical protein N7U66_02895 [Lacinutrix neustonica]|uniref:Uncharacterized protein n=1 Tax=Lacinutrix neustonica TaxID=2980107 RepID=A0A9E8MW85_9FLAO|nr:hypothetical protein [Lacinutrix neustonica]WAC02648.1 hypothetical protein N7U66_02895 [Lacinutrix neustonica]
MPNGGNGVYLFQWQKRITGNWVNIGGANSQNLNLGILYETTQYKRLVTSGGFTNTSNSVTITVVISEISNNTIQYHGSYDNQLIGSIPTGGNGSYEYQYLFVIDNILLGWSKQTIALLKSERLIAPPRPESYRFSTPWSTNKDYFDLLSNGTLSYAYERGIPIKVYRRVRSGTEVSISFSNQVIITPWYRTSNNLEDVLENGIPFSRLEDISETQITNIISIKLYPNPTSKLINFDIGINKFAKVRIMLFSIDLSVNDIVFDNYIDSKKVIKYHIPNHYRAGLYKYKVFVDNEELKNGTLILKR